MANPICSFHGGFIDVARPRAERPFQDRSCYNWHGLALGHRRIGNNGVHSLDIGPRGLQVEYTGASPAVAKSPHYAETRKRPTPMWPLRFWRPRIVGKGRAAIRDGFEGAKFGVSFTAAKRDVWHRDNTVGSMT